MSKHSGSSYSTSGGIGFPGLLTIAFIVLRLTGVIDWGWGWVLAPLWISLIVSLLLIAVVVGITIWAKP